MPISHFILHQLEKRPGSPVQIKRAPEEMTELERISGFVDELRSAYLGRLGREHGRFGETGEESPLARQLKQFVAGETAFVALAQNLLTQLADGLDAGDIEFRGHLILVQEQRQAGDLFYLFLVSHRHATAVDDDLSLRQVDFVDLGPSLMVAKVDLAEWQREEGSAYLSLATPRGARELAELFRQLVGFGEGLNKADDTRLFLDSVEAFSKQVPGEQAQELRSQVVDYCLEQDQQDEPVALDALARAVTAVDGAAFSSHLADSLPDHDALMVDRKCLRQYVKFSGRERDLAISFSASQLNNRVHYNQGTDTLSISGLPKSLRNQLLAHIEGQG